MTVVRVAVLVLGTVDRMREVIVVNSVVTQVEVSVTVTSKGSEMVVTKEVALTVAAMTSSKTQRDFIVYFSSAFG